MIVVSIANPKGGSGKTTMALLLAEFFTHAGKSVCLLDNDPTQNLVHWKIAREGRGLASPFQITERTSPDEYDNLIDTFSEEFDICIVDTEGVKDLMASVVTMSSDLVLIPLQASPMDARNAAAQLSIIKLAERHTKRKIPFRFVFTRVNAAIATKLFTAISTEMEGMPVADTRLVERAAYKHMHEDGALLSELDDKSVSGLANAKENALSLVKEVYEVLNKESV